MWPKASSFGYPAVALNAIMIVAATGSSFQTPFNMGWKEVLFRHDWHAAVQKFANCLNWAACAVVKDITIGAEGLKFDSRPVKSDSFATAASFLRSYVVQASSCGDEPHHSLHASA